jgi:4,4'-diaponeurosporenoate glycosyltransferase
MIYYALPAILTGLLIGLLLFHKLPRIDGAGTADIALKISVVIPARNEETNLPLLLADIRKQRIPFYEVMCVDDCSEDGTAAAARAFGATVIQAGTRPEGYTGKAWACRIGAEAASGDLLLFLDADVRLREDASQVLAATYGREKTVISIQPYHTVFKTYEHLSFFFNMTMIAANGLGLPFKNASIGLFGPVILIGKAEYLAHGGHETVKGSIVDDLSLGGHYNRAGLEYRLFMGGKYFAYRMYAGGIRQLRQGWTKNFATGARKTPFPRMAAIFLWYNSCALTVLALILSAVNRDWNGVLLYSAFYALWAVELTWIARRIGNYGLLTSMVYPIPLIGFIVIFINSMIRKLIHGNAEWKDRDVKTTG